ncbi:Cytochrome oxidase assembly [Cytospora paraplurivora]|uniref:Cytochrome c oxidase assembly protein COX16, mitochondrial n=1 Tax=Cytospora paraplurivora TaxID=2898453 RepID=A0AAN9U648_9PEZI
MGAFGNKKYVSAAEANSFAVRYRASLAKHPFLLFGLPFIAIIVAGSFVLTPATAIRYEKHDRKVRQMTREEELGVGKQGRKVNIKDEYYKLAAKDLDNWEQKRVERLKGENDGTL